LVIYLVIIYTLGGYTLHLNLFGETFYNYLKEIV